MDSALPAYKIKPMLEAEINRLRSPRIAELWYNDKDESDILGFVDCDFNFEV
ncbi:unnamed protein product [Rhizopus stolonifer]